MKNDKKRWLLLFITMLLPLLLVGIVSAGDDELEVRGIIESRPSGTFFGSWVIEGFAFTVDATTDIDQDEGPLVVGACAEVEYLPTAGTPVALKLDSKFMNECNEVEINGILDSFPAGLIGEWVVDGISYTATAATEFEMDDGPYAIGACVEIDYDPVTFVADKIDTDDDCIGFGNNDVRQRVFGELESFPPGLIGDWVVNGVTYTASASTIFDPENATFVVGECVRIDFIINTTDAIQIESDDDFHCGANGSGGHNGDGFTRFGLVDSFPTELVGTWVVDGVTYEAGVGTIFDQEDGLFGVGVCVELDYLPDTNILLKVETEDDLFHCGGNGGTIGNFQIIVGNLDSFPAELIGTWVVDGVSYTADATTQFKQEDGPFTVGGCVEVAFQTTNNLILEVETEDAFDCGNALTPPSAENSVLGANHTSGRNGSVFVFTANNFTPDQAVTVRLNGSPIGQARTNRAGWATFAIQTGGANRSANAISISVNGVNSNEVNVAVGMTGTQHVLPSGYSAPLLNPASVPTAIELVTVSADVGSAPLLFVLIATLGTFSLAAILRWRIENG